METLSMLSSLVKEETILFFVGGLASLLLTVVVVYAKQESKRNNKREELKQRPAEEVGDIEQKLNSLSGYGKVNIIEETTKYSIQPLLILSFVSMFSYWGKLLICFTMGLTLFTFLHEFSFAANYGKNKYYIVLIFLLWISLYFIISYANPTGLPNKV